MNGVRQRSLAVSVHDVSPLTRDAVAAMLRDLAEAGVGVTSLLVVPDHHHRADIDQDPAFLDWLLFSSGGAIPSLGYRPYSQGSDHVRE